VANQSEASLLLAEAPSRSDHARSSTTAQAGHFHVSRWLITLLMVAPWLIVAALLAAISLGVRFERSKAADVPADSRVVAGKPGRWGQLEYRSIRMDLPDEFVFVPPPDQPPVRWFFHGFSKEQALAFLQSSGITSAQRALIEKAPWKSEAESVSVEPGDEFILSLSPAARAAIYLRLVEFDENSRQIDPVWFRTGQVDDRLKDCGLSPSSIELLKSLLYAQGPSLLLFADFEPALRRLPNEEERRLFMNAVSRKRTLLAGLHVNPDSNMEAIIDYWGVGGRKRNVTPLLRALHHEGDAKVNIVCLLPDFPRDHIYMHPFANSADAGGLKQDCFWSAMNFFNDPPDNRVNDMNYLRDLLKSDYATINQPTQMGDVVFLATAKDAVIHAAAYIADDIVFTKNGESYTQPWILMHMEDMMDTYVVKHPSSGTLKALYYRKKTLF
jgi:hypothetical protein